MSTTIIRNPVLFDYQIPVSDVDETAFREAIQDKKVYCLINGARVNSINSNKVNVDISFKILQDLDVLNPGTSITGHTLSKKEIKSSNVKFKNVTVNFDLINNGEKDVIEVINEHEVYSILTGCLKAKKLMEKEQTGSIRMFYKNFHYYVRDCRIYLTSTKVTSRKQLEVTAFKGSETQK